VAGRRSPLHRVRPEPIPTQARASATGATSTGQQDRHGALRSSGARVRGNRGASTAGGCLPPQRSDQAAVRDALEALHDDFPLEAGMDQAGPASGDDAAPSPISNPVSRYL
jgi:hypothetical protein